MLHFLKLYIFNVVDHENQLNPRTTIFKHGLFIPLPNNRNQNAQKMSKIFEICSEATIHLSAFVLLLYKLMTYGNKQIKIERL